VLIAPERGHNLTARGLLADLLSRFS
ncbi:hypothetical protein SAMN05421505_10622, partial [Sinosporangium album]